VRLPLADRVLYAAGSLGNSTLFWSLGAWLLYFYAPPAEREELTPLIPLAVVAVARGIGQVFEAFDDPLIGWWSDRTRTRWGRRIPFLLLGTPLLALSFWLLWTPPVGASTLLLGLYFFIVLEVFYFANTIVGAPYEALQAEIATTSDDRVSLGVWKVAFGTVGVVLAFVVSPQLIERVGFAGMGAVLAAVAFVSLYVMLFGLWSRGTLSREAVIHEDTIGLRDSIRISLTHPPFRALALSFVLFSIGYNMLVGLMAYYVTVIHRLSEGDVSFFLAGVTVAVMIALPILGRAARRFGKRTVYAACMAAIGAYLAFLGIGAFQPMVPGITLETQAKVLLGLSGFGFAALFVFPGAMMADVIDDDTARTGHRRAGAYYGMFKTLEKLAQGAAALLFGVLLQVFGYSEDRYLGIQLALPVAGACALAGFAVIMVGYHLRGVGEPGGPAVAPAAPPAIP
jgi:GPH family glycoside/pentoside/hexuronide:cation symporter